MEMQTPKNGLERSIGGCGAIASLREFDRARRGFGLGKKGRPLRIAIALA